MNNDLTKFHNAIFTYTTAGFTTGGTRFDHNFINANSKVIGSHQYGYDGGLYYFTFQPMNGYLNIYARSSNNSFPPDGTTLTIALLIFNY